MGLSGDEAYVLARKYTDSQGAIGTPLSKEDGNSLEYKSDGLYNPETAISKADGNTLTKKADGLYVPEGLTKQIIDKDTVEDYIAHPEKALFTVIYLVKDDEAKGDDKYKTYVRVGDDTSSTFECIGDTSTDLSEYAKTKDLEDYATLKYVDDNKMDKVNPVGTGSFSLNRSSSYPVGVNSFAVGSSSQATGKEAIAIGMYSKASAEGSVAIAGGEASGRFSVAIGSGNRASTNYSFAFGDGNRADSVRAVAVGTYNRVDGDESVAVGYDCLTRMEAKHAVAIGSGTLADKNDSIAIGSSVEVIGAIPAKLYLSPTDLEHEREADHFTTGLYVSPYLDIDSGSFSWCEASLSWEGADVRIDIPNLEMTVKYRDLEYEDQEETIVCETGNSYVIIRVEPDWGVTPSTFRYSLIEETLPQSIEVKLSKAASYVSEYYTNIKPKDTIINTGIVLMNTSAIGMQSMAEGFGSHAKGKYSYSQGLVNVAEGDAQGVLGKYNKPNDHSAVIVGNGIPEAHSNALELEWDGSMLTPGIFHNNNAVGIDAMIQGIKPFARGILNGRLIANGDYYTLEDGAMYLFLAHSHLTTGAYRGTQAWLVAATLGDRCGAGATTTAIGVSRTAAMATVGTVGFTWANTTEKYVDDKGKTKYHSRIGIGSCVNTCYVKYTIYKISGSNDEF